METTTARGQNAMISNKSRGRAEVTERQNNSPLGGASRHRAEQVESRVANQLLKDLLSNSEAQAGAGSSCAGRIEHANVVVDGRHVASRHDDRLRSDSRLPSRESAQTRPTPGERYCRLDFPSMGRSVRAGAITSATTTWPAFAAAWTFWTEL